MFEISAGSSDDIARHRARQVAPISRGLAKTWHPLSGGSDTRRFARQYHVQRAVEMRVPFSATNCFVEIGGFVPTHDRGWRYLHDSRRGQWVNWRKAKRIARNSMG